MNDHQVTAADPAVLAPAARRFLEAADVFGAGGHTHRIRPPKCKRIDGRRRPPTARAAVAISHVFGIAHDFDLYASKEAFTPMNHHILSHSMRYRALLSCLVAFTRLHAGMLLADMR
jgi:hypothetical protein